MTGTPFLPGLSGLRALAAFWVLLLHLSPQIEVLFSVPRFLSTLMRYGSYGVDLFFILSGFIITHHYFDRLRPFSSRTYAEFLWNRAARLYPLHLLTLLLVLAMVVLAPLGKQTINTPEHYGVSSFIGHLFMVSAWQIPATVSWNHFAWAVSAEWLAYILSPLFFIILHRRIKTAFLFSVLVTLFLVTPIAHALLAYESRISYAVFRILSGFGIGVIACHLYRRGWGESLPWRRISLAVLFLILGQFLHKNVEFFLLPLLTLLLYAQAWKRESRPSRVNRFLSYWGRASYALYLMQFILLMSVTKLVSLEILIGKNILLRLSFLTCQVFLILWISDLTHRAFERPVRLWLRRRNPFREPIRSKT